jgi:hypothetical protein
MEMFYNRHYITVDEQSRITDGWSDGPRRDKDTTDAICINDKGGYQFRLILDGEATAENPPLYDFEYGIPLYKWDGSQVVARDDAELEAERAAIRAEREKQTKINSLKSQLAATDYQAIKYAEGWITAEEYAEAKALRQSLRDQINALES